MAEENPERGGPNAPRDDRDGRENGAPPPLDGGWQEYGGRYGQPGPQEYGGRYGQPGPQQYGGRYGQPGRPGPQQYGGRKPPRYGDWRQYGGQNGEWEGKDPQGPEGPRPGDYPPPNGPRDPRGEPYPGYPARADNSKAFSILSYIGILWLVGLLAGRDDPKVRFHVNQGIILSIFEFALGILISIMKSLITAVFIRLFSASILLPQLGMALNGMLSFVSWGLTAAYIIIGVVHAVQDRREPLPVIGRLFTVIS